MKSITPYLNFDGNCREAMMFYNQCLDGELSLIPFSEGPAMTLPEEAKDRIMHARLAKGAVELLASDTMPGKPFRQGNDIFVTIDCESLAEIEKLFAALGEGGAVTMPLQDTFWNARFGMLTDRFGINWMFNCAKTEAV